MNIAFLVGLTFGIAASANFPVLIMAMYWKGLTTRGAICGGLAGLVCALALVILSPTVWVTVLGHAEALFPYDHPALFSMPLAFVVLVLVSRLDRSAQARRDRDAFDDQMVRAETGLGIATAASH
ncbi:Cation/acetate symporter ActP [compost metagenome]